MGDAHGDVVGDNGQVIDGAIVAPQDDEIVEVPSLEADPAVNRVLPGDLFVLQEEPNSRRGSRADALLDLGRAESVAAPVVTKAGPGRFGPPSLGVELLP